MNILTFDIEEWFIQKNYFGDHREMYYKYDRYLNSILELLDEVSVKATFFCVGGMGRDFPEVVRKIDNHGHEIGCHSYQHIWLNKLSQQKCLEDTHMAVDTLEQCVGKKIKSYRAPAFSIGEQNKWAFEVLASCGIERDASVFPAVRDFGGFAQFGQKTPSRVSVNGVIIKEFPICTAQILGREVAFSGGGYFRFFPLWFVMREIGKLDYTMTYFHIADLIPEGRGLMSRTDFEAYFKMPGTLKNRYIRYVKANLGKKGAFDKMVQLITNSNLHFQSILDASSKIDWNETPLVQIK